MLSDLITVFHVPLAEVLSAVYCNALSTLVVSTYECSARLRGLLATAQQPPQDVFTLSHSPPMRYVSPALYCCSSTDSAPQCYACLEHSEVYTRDGAMTNVGVPKLLHVQLQYTVSVSRLQDNGT